jgi:hypothetical protein
MKLKQKSNFTRLIGIYLILCLVVRCIYSTDATFIFIPAITILALYIAFISVTKRTLIDLFFVILIAYVLIGLGAVGVDCIDVGLSFDTIFLIVGTISTSIMLGSFSLWFKIKIKSLLWSLVIFPASFFLTEMIYKLFPISQFNLPYFYILISMWQLVLFAYLYLLQYRIYKNTIKE